MWSLRVTSLSNLPLHYNLLTPLSQTPCAQWLMGLAAGPSPQTSRFYCIVHVKFVVTKQQRGKFFSNTLVLPNQYHATNTPHSYHIHLLSIISANGSIIKQKTHKTENLLSFDLLHFLPLTFSISDVAKALFNLNAQCRAVFCVLPIEG
jgi:hypothetical protein